MTGQLASGLRRHISTWNPLAPIFEIWSDAIVVGQASPIGTWLRALVISLVVFAVGFVVYVSRERDYAVRI